MSAALEARYRAALRWYPRRWRAANADAIVGTMLDQAEAEGRTTPLPGELRDLAASGVSTRFERFAPQVVRDRVAAIALAIGTAYALIMLVASEWAPFAISGPFNQWMPSIAGETRVPSSDGFGPFASVMVLVYGLWLLAFVLVLLKYSRSSRAVLLLTLPMLAWIRTLRFDDIGALQASTPGLIIVGLIAVLAAVGRPAAVPRRALLAMIVVIAALVSALMATNAVPAIYEGRLSAAVGTFSVLHAPGYAAVLLIAGAALAVRHQRAWAVAAVVSAAPWLALASLYVVPYVFAVPVGLGLAVLCMTAATLVWRATRPRRTSALS